jgi:hypothetical protein
LFLLVHCPCACCVIVQTQVDPHLDHALSTGGLATYNNTTTKTTVGYIGAIFGWIFACKDRGGEAIGGYAADGQDVNSCVPPWLAFEHLKHNHIRGLTRNINGETSQQQLIYMGELRIEAQNKGKTEDNMMKRNMTAIL